MLLYACIETGEWQVLDVFMASLAASSHRQMRLDFIFAMHKSGCTYLDHPPPLSLSKVSSLGLAPFLRPVRIVSRDKLVLSTVESCVMV